MPTSWDEALDLVAERFSDTIAAYGRNAVALYVSGQLLTEDYYAANKFAKGFLGTGNIDSNSRLCMASAVAGHKRAFGEDVVPGIYEDLELADLVVLVGSNTAWCHPVLYQRILAARARPPGDAHRRDRPPPHRHLRRRRPPPRPPARHGRRPVQRPPRPTASPASANDEASPHVARAPQTRRTSPPPPPGNAA